MSRRRSAKGKSPSPLCQGQVNGAVGNFDVGEPDFCHKMEIFFFQPLSPSRFQKRSARVHFDAVLPSIGYFVGQLFRRVEDRGTESKFDEIHVRARQLDHVPKEVRTDAGIDDHGQTGIARFGRPLPGRIGQLWMDVGHGVQAPFRQGCHQVLPYCMQPPAHGSVTW